MKRIISFLLVCAFTSGLTNAQKMIEIYKNGPVRLIAEKNYGSGNDWDKLFNLYYDTLDHKYIDGSGNQYTTIKNGGREEEKRIIIAPDGSVFMSHKNRHEIWKFGPDGTFLKKFGTKGGKAYQFPMLPSVQPVVDGKYIFTDDVNARLKFFDLEGNYFKSITLKYMTDDFQPIGNGDILLTGSVMWKAPEPGTRYIAYRWRRIVVKLNLYTGEEKIIHSILEEPDSKYLNTTNRDSMQIIQIAPPGGKIYMPNYRIFSKPEILLLGDGRFIVLNRSNGEVKLYDKTGKESSSFRLDITPRTLTEKDALDNYESVKQRLLQNIKNAEAMPDPEKRISKGEQGTKPGTVLMTSSFPDKKAIIKRAQDALLSKIDELKDINKYYPNLPYFSNLIHDDEGTMLLFEFTDKDQKEDNIFNVIAYDSNGKKLARTSFICDDYDLSFSEDTFVISKGYVYAVAKLKNDTGMPLRLVKFKMTN
jgi:hypothetical protein